MPIEMKRRVFERRSPPLGPPQSPGHRVSARHLSHSLHGTQPQHRWALALLELHRPRKPKSLFGDRLKTVLRPEFNEKNEI